MCDLGNLQQLLWLPIFHNISIGIKIVAEVNHIPKWRLYHNLPYFRLKILVIYISQIQSIQLNNICKPSPGIQLVFIIPKKI